jgi:hypothetical protein
LCMKLDNQNSLVCESCISLKYYLAKQIWKHDNESPQTHSKCQNASSSVSFDYLSPRSKKARVVSMRNEIRGLRVQLSQAEQLFEIGWKSNEWSG